MTKYSERMMVRFTPAQLALLQQQADASAIPVAVYVRHIVKAFLDQATSTAVEPTPTVVT